MKRYAIFLFFLFAFFVFSNAQTASISNVISSQRIDGSGQVDINFDLAGTGTYYINLEISFNGGSTYSPIAITYLSGDVGPISPGTNKHIIWNGLQSSPNTYSTQAKLKLVANTFPQSVVDVDGNVYNTVQIGSQVWMMENLRVTHYQDGSNIALVTTNASWSGLSTGAYCWYNNVSANGNTYGALYNWYAVNDARNICPTGWHRPSDAEWTILTTFLGGESVAGGAIKETGTTHWISPNVATNTSGFTALPAGWRYSNGTWGGLGTHSNFWTSTNSSSNYAWNRGLLNSVINIARSNDDKHRGFSVRCLKD